MRLARPLQLYFDLEGDRRRRVGELLEMTELSRSPAGRMPDELSGAQKHRVAPAMALRAEPDLIICDEITSALDQLIQESVLRLLERLQKSFDTTYLFITHDRATMQAIADGVMVTQVDFGPSSATASRFITARK
ncbi:MAG: hypothetical protein JNL61_12545 [Rhizobiaceae bacterium]|nr:hypothetical protein [Rhizobiaceae bacterium]